jgi:general nucleoside transport system permease protein
MIEANSSKPDLHHKRVSDLRLLLGGLSPVLVVLFALMIGAFLILLSGHDPIEAYISLVLGAVGSVGRFSETLVKTIPLLVMGLAVSIAFKNGFWNIGGEGQFLAGATLATAVGLAFSGLPALLLVPLCFLSGFLGGALWGLIAGVLKVRFNVNEVISTLMLNYIALYLFMYLIRGPMMDRTSIVSTGLVFPQSALLPKVLFLPILLEKTRLHAGLFLALAILVITWLLWRTRIGFEIEASGSNREAASYAGMNVGRVVLLVSFVSGGLAGLVGWSEVFGVHHRLLDAITGGYGYLGIVVALLGNLHPFGILLSSFLFSALTVGGNAMERATGISFTIVSVINGLVIIFLLVRIALQKKIQGVE